MRRKWGEKDSYIHFRIESEKKNAWNDKVGVDPNTNSLTALIIHRVDSYDKLRRGFKILNESLAKLPRSALKILAKELSDDERQFIELIEEEYLHNGTK
ncbi:hypothetical protein [Candidatus Borrarchaeum sp.]|uniref:hypothetical protein n=1 Tax=Candidatus Borrarchaeum sp. TaxID=2846742 RepID=UPI00257F9EC8|nr:hypothetical protein [Candidatus Borrarchaeum sp.]